MTFCAKIKFTEESEVYVMLKLYENIKNRRLELGMTQTQLAEKLGYADKSMIAKIEKGLVDIPLSKIMAFAEALRMDPGDLMGDDGLEPEAYYLDPEVAEMAQELATRPEIKIMFDASRNLSKESIEKVTAIIEMMSDK